MSELFDKEVNTQKESLKKASGVHASSHKPTKIVHENKTKKNYAHIKLLLMKGSTLYVGHMQKTAENVLDKLQANNSGHNEGTICLVNRRIGVKGWFFKRGCMNGCH